MPELSVQMQVVVNIICATGGAVFGYILKREIRIATLEVQFKNIDDKLAAIQNDINGIALFVGTPRALAAKAKTENKGDANA